MFAKCLLLLIGLSLGGNQERSFAAAASGRSAPVLDDASDGGIGTHVNETLISNINQKTKTQRKPPCIAEGGNCLTSGSNCDGKVLVGKHWCKKTQLCCIPVPSNDMVWTPFKYACIKGHNIAVIDNVKTFEDCKVICTSQYDKRCRSIDYEVKPQICFISDQNSDSPDYTTPCHDDPLAKFSERIHEDCPKLKGYFYFPPSGQCFKFLQTPKNFADAQKLCTDQPEGSLTLAHPYLPVELRTYMTVRFGGIKVKDQCWLNAKRTTGSTDFKWLDNEATIPLNSNPLWGRVPSTGDNCLYLIVNYEHMELYHNAPLSGLACDHHVYQFKVLCEWK